MCMCMYVIQISGGHWWLKSGDKLYLYIYFDRKKGNMMSSAIAKCGYCGWLLKMDNILKHSCFGLFDATCQVFSVDEAGKIVMTDINLMETTGDESLNDVTENENNALEPQEVDEELISIVQQRPALYDPRLPLQERTKLKKKDLWQEVSNCLGGAYSPIDAEKKWQYLRDCYTKARRNFKKIQSIEKRSGAAGTSVNKRNKPSFRYYDAMNFLNDTLEYKETCTSLRFPNRKDTAQVTNNLFAPSPSFSNSPMNNSNDCTDSENRPPSTAPLPSFSNSPMNNSNDCTDSENRPPSTPSPSISELSVATSALRKRQHSSNIDEVDRAFLQTLNTNVQPNPIDGFMLRLAEGMRRLPYRERSQLELEFLIKLRETEERLGLLNN
ncbi:uncharacterized protein LOC143908344 isoform X1 [Temnothorax americanus]|uniref:uncharacterized protein LOC143908344 isoform X1 n=2 Tax=Temnothorax americanus TaxID=1964332 RepID=UPI0040676729